MGKLYYQELETASQITFTIKSEKRRKTIHLFTFRFKFSTIKGLKTPYLGNGTALFGLNLPTSTEVSNSITHRNISGQPSVDIETLYLGDFMSFQIDKTLTVYFGMNTMK